MPQKPQKPETRVIQIPASDLRNEGGEDSRRLSGVVITYGKTTDIGYFREQFETGCFTKHLGESSHNIRALYNHMGSHLLSSTQNETLTLIDDADALRFELDVAKTSYGDDVLELVRSGEVRGMSFAFNAVVDEYKNTPEDPSVLRTVKEARLYEITVTAIPAYGDSTSVSARNAGEIDADAIAKAKALAETPPTPPASSEDRDDSDPDSSPADRPELRHRETVLRRHLLAQQLAA